MAPDTHQFVDNNLGFAANGLVWTVRMRTSAVDVDFESGEASYAVEHLAVTDYGTPANSIFGGGAPGISGPGIPSTVSFDVNWHDVLSTQAIRNTTLRFEGTFKQTNAHIEWSMRNANGFHFRANPSGQTTIAAVLGRERNGVFFT